MYPIVRLANSEVVKVGGSSFGKYPRDKRSNEIPGSFVSTITKGAEVKE
jgi:hypothetical protein